MVFWIILVIFIICGLYTLITSPFAYDSFDNKYPSYSSIVTLAFGAVVLILLVIILLNRLNESKDRPVHQQEYQTLIYKAKEYNKLQNKFNFNKELIIDEIHEYNTDLAIYKARENNFWIGIFYGRNLYENCDYINLEDLNIDN